MEQKKVGNTKKLFTSSQESSGTVVEQEDFDMKDTNTVMKNTVDDMVSDLNLKSAINPPSPQKSQKPAKLLKNPYKKISNNLFLCMVKS